MLNISSNTREEKDRVCGTVADITKVVTKTDMAPPPPCVILTPKFALVPLSPSHGHNRSANQGDTLLTINTWKVLTCFRDKLSQQSHAACSKVISMSQLVG